MKITIIIIAALLFVSTSSWCQEAGKDWPQLDGFSERLSRSDVSYEPPFEFLKRLNVGFGIEYFTYVDGIVYFASPQSENLFGAFDLQAEEVLWTFTLPESRASVGVNPAISDSMVYVGGQQAKGLYGLHRITGDSIWFQPVGLLFGRDIAIKGDLLYVNTHQGLMCFNKTDGSIQWTFQEWSPQYVCAVDELQVYYSNNDTIYGLDRMDGSINWKVPYKFEGDRYEVNMLVYDDQVLIKRTDDLVILNTSDGSILNEIKLPVGTGIDRAWGIIAQTADSYLVHSRKDSSSKIQVIQKINKPDGGIIWQKDLGESSFGPSILFGNYFTVVNEGDIEIRAIETGEVIQSFSDRSYNSRARVKPVDIGILAVDDQFINIFTPSTTTAVKWQEDLFNWKILGNPSLDNTIQVDIESDNSKRIKYRIVASSGEMVSKLEEFSVRTGKQSYIIHTHLDPGAYFLTMYHEEWRSTKKFIILK